MRKIGDLVWMICVCWPLWAVQGEVDVQAALDRTVMTKGDTFTLSVSITSDKSVDVGQPRLPHLDQFELLRKWVSQSTVGSWGTQKPKGNPRSDRKKDELYQNGKGKRITKTFNYMLATRQSGKQEIGSIEVVVSGTVYRISPILLDVLPAGQVPPGGKQGRGKGQSRRRKGPPDSLAQMDDVFDKLLNRGHPTRPRTQLGDSKESLFVRVDVDKSKVFVGEQVMVSWYIYTRGHIREIDTLEHPSNKGFWKEDIHIATRLHFTSEVVDGIVYRKALLASYALFPLKEGPALIDSYKVKCVVVQRSTYGFGHPIQYIKTSQPVHLEVMPLPSENPPADFSGAVGTFVVSSQLDGRNVSVNQPVTLTVRFSGQGNAKLIDLPELKLPTSLEVYDTKKESRFFKSGQSYKEFEVLLVPRSSGPFIIPSMSVSAFNPQTGEYYRQRTKEHRLTVRPAQGESIISTSPLEGNERKAQLQLPNVIASWESQGFGESNRK